VHRLGYGHLHGETVPEEERSNGFVSRIPHTPPPSLTDPGTPPLQHGYEAVVTIAPSLTSPIVTPQQMRQEAVTPPSSLADPVLEPQIRPVSEVPSGLANTPHADSACDGNSKRKTRREEDCVESGSSVETQQEMYT